MELLEQHRAPVPNDRYPDHPRKDRRFEAPSYCEHNETRQTAPRAREIVLSGHTVAQGDRFFVVSNGDVIELELVK